MKLYIKTIHNSIISVSANNSHSHITMASVIFSIHLGLCICLAFNLSHNLVSSHSTAIVETIIIRKTVQQVRKNYRKCDLRKGNIRINGNRSMKFEMEIRNIF